MEIFKLVGSIFVDTDKANDSISKTDEKTESLGKKLGSGIKTAAKWGAAIAAGAGAAAAGVVKLTGSVAETGDNIDKASQKMGISAKAYQEWDAVVQHSGTSMSAMRAGFKTMSKAIQSGTDDQVAALTKLGLNIDDLKTMSTEDAFDAVITSLQGMKEGTERTTIATTLLGKSGIELGALLNTSAKDTKKMKNEVNALGGVMSNKAVKAAAKYQDTLQDMQTGFEGLRRSIGARFLNPFIKTMQGITLLTKGDTDKGTKKIVKGIKEILKTIVDLGPEIKKVGGPILDGIVDGFEKNLPNFVGFGLKLIKKIASGINEAIPGALDSLVGVINYFIDYLGTIGVDGADAEGFVRIGEAILNAISNINWSGLAINLVSLAEAIFNSLVSALVNFGTDHPAAGAAISTALIGFLALANNAKLAARISKALAPFASQGMVGFLAALAAAFAGFSFGKWLGDNYLTSDKMKEYQVDFKLSDFLKFDDDDWDDFWQAFADWWVDVEDWWSKKFSGMKKKVSGWVSNIGGAIKNAINTHVIDLINSGLHKINKATNVISKIPGVSIGKIDDIPHLAKGGTVTQSGVVQVGETGPELLNLPKGSAVTPINSQNNALSGVEVSLETIVQLLNYLIAAVKESGAGANGEDMSIKLNNREFARLVRKVVPV